MRHVYISNGLVVWSGLFPNGVVRSPVLDDLGCAVWFPAEVVELDVNVSVAYFSVGHHDQDCGSKLAARAFA